MCPLLGPLAAPLACALSVLDFGLLVDLVMSLLGRYSITIDPIAPSQLLFCLYPGSDLARPLLLPLATPPCASDWGPLPSGHRRPVALTDLDPFGASRRFLLPDISSAWFGPVHACRLRARFLAPLPFAALDASSRRFCCCPVGFASFHSSRCCFCSLPSSPSGRFVTLHESSLWVFPF